MASSTSRSIVTLAVVLAVVVIVSVIAVALVSGPKPEPEDQTSTATFDFDLSPLQRPEYVQLNRQLILEGAVPVAPPPAVGKAIPFL